VPPFYPFERREENGTVFHYGRGTVDAKGPVATMIIASHKFFESRSDTPRLGMLFVVGEETGGSGMKAFAQYTKNTTFKAAIFGEPTEGKLASGHKGSLGLTLDVKGKSAHSAYPWLGISAINYLAEAIVALNLLEPSLPQSELLGATTLNTGLIRGGVAGNVVPESANASVSIRISRSEDDAVSTVRDIVTRYLAPLKSKAEEANATFSLIWSNSTYPAPILDTDVEGLEVAPVFYGTDIPSLPQVEKKYLFGTGTIEVAHTSNEGLSQGELVQAAEAYGLILESLFPRNETA
jgi:acetylornithine deacetylase